MALDVDSPTRRIPSLVNLCQRVAVHNVDFIYSLGDDLSYSLVKPILERCTAEQLARLEHASPHLDNDTPEIWKDFCLKKYPLAVARDISGNIQEPQSWREYYFTLGEAEAKRLEEISTKLRTQRHEADERKREREIKVTDRLPPPKRQRTGWSTAGAPPKTLFDKTRSKASNIQKNMYHARILPPMPSSKNYRVLPKPPDCTLPVLPPSSNTTRVTVKSVVLRRPVSSTSVSSRPSIQSSSSSSSLSNLKAASSMPLQSNSSSQQKPPSQSSPTNTPDSRPFKSPTPTRKDPMASLFVPKRRGFSQRPTS